MIKQSEVLRLIASIKFREFDETDWMAFQGCGQSETPMIGETDKYHVILDGDAVCVLSIDPESDQQTFFLDEY